jgi:sulfhydrogenase subunit beta (sulfur reductase)
MPKVISRGEIPNLLNHLKKTQDVFGPQKKGQEIIFDKVEEPGKVLLGYHTTLLPPKIYFLPAEEELFKVTNSQVQETEIKKPFIVFGLSLKDLAAVVQLDQIMGKKPADAFYLNRRKLSTLVGISENEVGVPPGGDLILEKVSDSTYRAIVLTAKGRKIASLGFFKEKEIIGKAKQQESRTKLDEMILDSELVAKAVEWSRENYSPIWERLGKVCLGCGICTYVCPLCYCTSTEDKTSFDRSVCTRCRKWDACTLPGFAKISGGHNFRPDQKSRYFNWFYHKFVRAYKEFGQVQCVACHRCQKYCPAGINIEKVLEEIIVAFQKAQPVRKF